MITASDLEGATVLVGITYVSADGSYTQEQFAGKASIEDDKSRALVKLLCTDGISRQFPFDPQSLQRAAAGEYRLRTTGETVTNPDFLMTWEVIKEQ